MAEKDLMTLLGESDPEIADHFRQRSEKEDRALKPLFPTPEPMGPTKDDMDRYGNQFRMLTGRAMPTEADYDIQTTPGEDFRGGVLGAKSSVEGVGLLGSTLHLDGLQRDIDHYRSVAREAERNGDALTASAATETLLRRQASLEQAAANWHLDAKSLLDTNALLGEVPVDTAFRKFMDSKSTGELLGNFLASPLRVSQGILLRSIPSSAPSYAGGIAGYAVGGVPGAAIGAGLGSGVMELGNSIVDKTQELAAREGLQLKDVLKDQETWSKFWARHQGEIIPYALTRAGIIGTFDGASALASVKIAGSSSLSVRQKIGAGIAVGGVLGGAGEAGAQLATEGGIKDVAAVGAEIVGEALFGGLEARAFLKGGKSVDEQGRAREAQRAELDKLLKEIQRAIPLTPEERAEVGRADQGELNAWAAYQEHLEAQGATAEQIASARSNLLAKNRSALITAGQLLDDGRPIAEVVASIQRSLDAAKPPVDPTAQSAESPDGTVGERLAEAQRKIEVAKSLMSDLERKIVEAGQQVQEMPLEATPDQEGAPRVPKVTESETKPVAPPEQRSFELDDEGKPRYDPLPQPEITNQVLTNPERVVNEIVNAHGAEAVQALLDIVPKADLVTMAVAQGHNASVKETRAELAAKVKSAQAEPQPIVEQDLGGATALSNSPAARAKFAKTGEVTAKRKHRGGAKSLTPETGLRLTQYLINEGGVRAPARSARRKDLLGDMTRLPDSGGVRTDGANLVGKDAAKRPGLFTKKGLALDDAALWTRLLDNGYIEPWQNPFDENQANLYDPYERVLDLLNDDINDRPVYSNKYDQAAAQAELENEAYIAQLEARIDAELKAMDVNTRLLPRAVQEDTLKYVLEGNDVAEAHELAFQDYIRRDEQLLETEQRGQTGSGEPRRSPGWDIPGWESKPAPDEGSRQVSPASSPAEPAVVSAFKTAKGSTYSVHADGTTTRNKAERSDPGHEGDKGLKPRTAKTIYVQSDASVLSAAGLENLGERGARVAVKGDRAILLTWNERAGKWGAAESVRQGIPFTTEPAIGAYPLELWKPADDVPGWEAYRGMHAGNKIVELGPVTPAQSVSDVVYSAPGEVQPNLVAAMGGKVYVKATSSANPDGVIGYGATESDAQADALRRMTAPPRVDAAVDLFDGSLPTQEAPATSTAVAPVEEAKPPALTLTVNPRVTLDGRAEKLIQKIAEFLEGKIEFKKLANSAQRSGRAATNAAIVALGGEAHATTKLDVLLEGLVAKLAADLNTTIAKPEVLESVSPIVQGKPRLPPGKLSVAQIDQFFRDIGYPIKEKVDGKDRRIPVERKRETIAAYHYPENDQLRAALVKEMTDGQWPEGTARPKFEAPAAIDAPRTGDKAQVSNDLVAVDDPKPVGSTEQGRRYTEIFKEALAEEVRLAEEKGLTLSPETLMQRAELRIAREYGDTEFSRSIDAQKMLGMAYSLVQQAFKVQDLPLPPKLTDPFSGRSVSAKTREHFLKRWQDIRRNPVREASLSDLFYLREDNLQETLDKIRATTKSTLESLRKSTTDRAPPVSFKFGKYTISEGTDANGSVEINAVDSETGDKSAYLQMSQSFDGRWYVDWVENPGQDGWVLLGLFGYAQIRFDTSLTPAPILSDSGRAFNLQLWPEIERTYANVDIDGASWWLSPKAVLGMRQRYQYELNEEARGANDPVQVEHLRENFEYFDSIVQAFTPEQWQSANNATLFSREIETTTRLYRGEPANAEGGTGVHYTRSLDRARGFAGPDGKVFYVDVPIERMGELGRGRGGQMNYTLPEDLQAQRKEWTPETEFERAPAARDDLRERALDLLAQSKRGELPEPLRLAFDAIKEKYRNWTPVSMRDNNRVNPALPIEGDPNVSATFDSFEELGIIHVMMHALDPEAKLRHEIIHALKYFNLFKPDEWLALVEKAYHLRAEIEADPFYVAKFHEQHDGDPAAIYESVNEEAVARYIEGLKDGSIKDSASRRILDRILKFFNDVTEALFGQGVLSSETLNDIVFREVIRRLNSGEIASRPPTIPGRPASTEMSRDPDPAMTVPKKGPDPRDVDFRQPQEGFQAGASIPVTKSKQQIVSDLANGLDMLVRRGDFDRQYVAQMARQGQRVTGQYNKDAAVARVLSFSDLNTVSHEVGHHLLTDPKAGPGLRALAGRFQSELTPIASPGVDPVEEGVSEFMRRYILNPRTARMRAPQFYAEFETYMASADPERFAVLRQAQADYTAWITSLSVDSVDATIVNPNQPATLRETAQNVVDYLTDNSTQEMLEDGRSSFAIAMDKAVAGLVDKTYAVQRVVDYLTRIAIENGNIKADARIRILAEDDPRKLVQNFPGVITAARAALLFGPLNYVERGSQTNADITRLGPSFREALTHAFGTDSWADAQTQSFGSYMASRMLVLRWVQHRPELLSVVQAHAALHPEHAAIASAAAIYAKRGGIDYQPHSLPISRHLENILIKEQENPTYARAFQLYTEYQRGLITRAWQAGLPGMTDEVYQELMAHADYVPLWRDISNPNKLEQAMFSGSSTGPDPRQQTQAFRKSVLKGELLSSENNILNPITSIMQATMQIERAIAWNEMVSALVDMAQAAGRGSAAIGEVLPSTKVRQLQVNVQQTVEAAGRQAGIPRSDLAQLLLTVDAAVGEKAMANVFQMAERQLDEQGLLWYSVRGEMRAFKLGNGEMARDLFELYYSLGGSKGWDLMLNWLGAAKNVMQAGVTADPVYQGFNWARDQVGYGVSAPGYTPFVTGARGLHHIATNSKFYQDYLAYGGAQGGPEASSVQADKIDSIRGRSLRTFRGWNEAFTSWEGFKRLWSSIEFMESASRVGWAEVVYNQALADGLTKAQAMRDAVTGGRNIMDFDKSGFRMESANRTIPFLRAQIVGLDRLIGSLSGRYNNDVGKLIEDVAQGPTSNRRIWRETEAPEYSLAMRTWMRLGALVIASVVIHALTNTGNDDDEANRYEQGRFWRINLGNGYFIFLPKPLDYAPFIAAGENMYKQFIQGNKRALSDFAGVLKDMWTLPWENPALKTVYGITTNYDTFRQGPIETTQMQGLRPEDRYNLYTSEFAKGLGRLTGTSPVMIDYAVSSLFATMGRYALDMTNVAAEKAGISNRPAVDWRDYAAVNRVLRPINRSTMSAEVMRQKVAPGGEYAKAAGSLEDHLKAGEYRRADELLTSLPEQARTWAVLKIMDRSNHLDLHPMGRAQAVSSILSGVLYEAQVDRLRQTEKGRQEFKRPGALTKLSPDDKLALERYVREIQKREMSNGLKLAGEPGWDHRDWYDTEMSYAALRERFPGVFAEIERRVQQRKIMSFDSLRNTWPEIRGYVNRQDVRESVALYQLDDVDRNLKTFTRRLRPMSSEYGWGRPPRGQREQRTLN